MRFIFFFTVLIVNSIKTIFDDEFQRQFICSILTGSLKSDLNFVVVVVVIETINGFINWKINYKLCILSYDLSLLIELFRL